MLEHLGLIGVSWRQGSSESLADFTLPPGSEAERLLRFAERAQLSELAYLATCNRVELIFARRDSLAGEDLRPIAFELLTGRAAAPGEAERRLRAWAGEGAAEHLFMVAAGLDSACIGEAEITGQVRRCHELSLELGLCGPSLDILFEEALRIAAHVRGETALGKGRTSLAEIAVDHLRARFRTAAGPIALLGVSAMTERAARSLSKDAIPLLFVNRTAAKAEALARRYQGTHASLADFLRDPPSLTALLTATGAGAPVLSPGALERLAARGVGGQAPLIIDMAVPGDAPADPCARLAIPRIGMDKIVEDAEHNRSARLLEAAQAREYVDRALETLHEVFAERRYAPLFAALQRRYQRTAQEGVARLLKKQLKGLGPEERAAIENWAEVLARRFAHIPCLGLRGLLHHGPEGAMEAFLAELEPQFANELREALALREPPS